MRKQAANIITSSRILCGICLWFCPVFSVSFYILYLFCGITDMVDGTIARKANSDSEVGARLDTVADIVFLAVCFAKILPLLYFPLGVWTWIAVIAAIKIVNIIWGYVLKKQFTYLHTVMNKVTGLILFLLPLTLSFAELKYSSLFVCSIATFSAIQEMIYIVTDCENK